MLNSYGNVLVAGCGGTGIEVLKILLTKSFRSLTLIDHDKVELSNLNRQFFFNKNDVGKYKSEVIATKLKKIKEVTFIAGKVEDMDDNIFYDIIFCCLDSISSRMSLNLLKFRTLIDCGIEGNKLHVKKVIKGVTSCLYCIKDLYSNDEVIESCSKREYSHKKIENEHNFNIDKTIKLSLDKEMNLEFVNNGSKNIISSVCYTNSISASLAFYLLSSDKFCFITFNGFDFYKMKIKKDESCIVCSAEK